LEKGAVKVHGGEPRPIRFPKVKWPVRTGRVRTGPWPSRLGTATGAMRANAKRVNSIASFNAAGGELFQCFSKIAQPNQLPDAQKTDSQNRLQRGRSVAI
ncbi:hypothetical protein, partial [Aphanothece microscopica]|uniref:hypothetical protein n=1 Tax=Aphanothece microscopica TaxID=1049561 RepID=UPI0039854418